VRPTPLIKKRLESVLQTVDIQIDGDRPWDIEVRDDRFYRRVVSRLSLGLGEAYVEGWWDCERLDQLFERIYGGDLQAKSSNVAKRLYYLRSRLLNLQRPSRAFMVGEQHYDLGNDLYRIMLGDHMIYSSCYWRSASSLEEAEDSRLQLIAEKLELKPGQRILDIGCGFGGFARFAAMKFGVEVLGVTVSKLQVELAKERCAGLPVEIRLQDYRDVQGEFDRVVALGVLVHVGYKNYRRFMEVAHRLLREDGLFLVHTMGANRSTTAAEPFIDAYIFKNGMAPSIEQIARASQGTFVMEDWHNLGSDYSRTAMEWLRNFESRWHEIRHRYDERFFRVWKYYLHMMSAAFRARTLQTWDIVFSKPGRPGYLPVR
jgi:cyclopropane-fatty-acyl-phospholipid synthase